MDIEHCGAISARLVETDEDFLIDILCHHLSAGHEEAVPVDPGLVAFEEDREGALVAGAGARGKLAILISSICRRGNHSGAGYSVLMSLIGNTRMRKSSHALWLRRIASALLFISGHQGPTIGQMWGNVG